jgi:transcriptional regulator with XRE-family HTH domain
MAFNLALKVAIVESRIPQIAIAEKTGIHESRLSRIIHGYLEPREDEKAAIARALRRPVHQLFPSEAA